MHTKNYLKPVRLFLLTLFRLLPVLAAGMGNALAMDTTIPQSMQKASDTAMDAVTGRSFAEFTLENNIATVRLNVHAETWAEVGSFKTHHDDGLWDQNWSDVMLGASEEDPFRVEGFVIGAEFDDLDRDDRQLLRLKMGFEKAAGIMEADFTSFTGSSQEGDFYRDAYEGRYEFTGEGDHFFMILDTAGPHGPGVYMDFGDAKRLDGGEETTNQVNYLRRN